MYTMFEYLPAVAEQVQSPIQSCIHHFSNCRDTFPVGPGTLAPRIGGFILAGSTITISQILAPYKTSSGRRILGKVSFHWACGIQLCLNLASNQTTPLRNAQLPTSSPKSHAEGSSTSFPKHCWLASKTTSGHLFSCSPPPLPAENVSWPSSPQDGLLEHQHPRAVLCRLLSHPGMFPPPS